MQGFYILDLITTKVFFFNKFKVVFMSKVLNCIPVVSSYHNISYVSLLYDYCKPAQNINTETET